MRIFLGSLGLAAALTACDIVDPDPVCACTPPAEGFAVIKGTVIGPDALPVENARVSAHLVSDAPCGAPSTLGTALITTSGGEGQYRYALGWQGHVTKCWALWALPPAGSSLTASDTVLMVVSYAYFPGDSITAQLQLR